MTAPELGREVKAIAERARDGQQTTAAAILYGIAGMLIAEDARALVSVRAAVETIVIDAKRRAERAQDYRDRRHGFGQPSDWDMNGGER